MTGYHATTELPPLVREAMRLAERLGFTGSCLPEVGRLLRVLAAGVGGVAAEIGTGCGVGTSWIASGLPPGGRLVTVEIDLERAAAARALLRADPRVEVLVGDWHAILEHAPFRLLFADGGGAKQHEPETLLTALAPGGLILLDDLTPEEHWPEAWHDQPDPVRDVWLNDPRLIATELLTTPRTAVIVGVRG